jgi:hypothetical protein
VSAVEPVRDDAHHQREAEDRRNCTRPIMPSMNAARSTDMVARARS